MPCVHCVMPWEPVSTQDVISLSSEQYLFMVAECGLVPTVGVLWSKLDVIKAAQSLSDALTASKRSEQAVMLIWHARRVNTASDSLSLPFLRSLREICKGNPGCLDGTICPPCRHF